MSSTPAKQWTILVTSPVSGPLEVRRDGVSLDLNQIGPGQVTPVELLLISIATCFALSCHAAFPLRHQQRIAFEVEVAGSKAEQRPSRLSNIRLAVRFTPGLPLDETQHIASLAKQLCTVTNTLAAAPAFAVDVTVG
jgi:uncharacterized OsmC-like protein